MKLIVLLLCALSFSLTARDFDHSKVVGAGKCMECHKQAGKSWNNTTHSKIFKKFHKKKEAKEIAKKLGIKRIKKEGLCLECHYTRNEKMKPISGISCESCHGPAKDWVKIHNDYGGKDITKAQETAAHKKSRIAKAEKSGMIHPSNIYNVAKNCFECHTVPHENLVETGGHKAGSDFELVSWSQGEVLHNFHKGGGKNIESPQERKRTMYIIGRVLDLEYGLRGVAEVTKATPYAIKMAKRVAKALGYIKQVNDAAKIPELSEIYKIGKSAKLAPNNKKALMAAANKISKIAQKLAVDKSVTAKATIDAFIPSERKGAALK